MYNLLQFLHVAAAIIWIGSGIGLVALFGVLNSAGERETLLNTSRHVEKLGTRLFAPSAMATLIFGILTVLASEGSIGFEDLWIVIGFAGVALSLVFVAVSNPNNRKIGEAAAAEGPNSETVTRLLAKGRMLNYVDITLLLVVVWAMVTKPGG